MKLGGYIDFLIVEDFGEFKYYGILEVPLRGIFPFSVWEVSVGISLPIVVVLFIVIVLVNNRVFRRFKEVGDRLSEIARSGGI